MSRSYIDSVLELKPRESYPESVDNEIALLSFFPKGLATPFGSYIYRFQKYAGDIDLLESFPDYKISGDNKYKTENVVIQQFIKRLKAIIRSLGKNHYFSEFKAGMDHAYDIDVGTLANGHFTPDSNLRNNCNILYEKGLLNETEMYFIGGILSDLHLMNVSEQENAYDAIYFMFREKRILRWTKDEILQGYKMIRGKKYTLATALKDNTIVKIDLVVLINNKFVEVTNILSLAYKKDGALLAINLDSHAIHSPEGLRIEVEKWFYSNKFYSPLKACKRMYSYSRASHQYQYVKQLVDILGGNLSLLYQIKSEIDSFILLIDKLKNPPIKQIKRQLNELKGKLNTVLEIPNDMIILISNIIDYVGKLKNKNDIHYELKECNKILKDSLSDLSIHKMNQLGLNPIPNMFLPNRRSYANVIRKVGDRPNKAFKDFEDLYLKFAISKTEKLDKIVESDTMHFLPIYENKDVKRIKYEPIMLSKKDFEERYRKDPKHRKNKIFSKAEINREYDLYKRAFKYATKSYN